MLQVRFIVLLLLMAANLALLILIGVKTVMMISVQPERSTISNSIPTFCHKVSEQTSCENNKTVNGFFYCCEDQYEIPVRSVIQQLLDQNYEHDKDYDEHLRQIREDAAIVNKNNKQHKPVAHVHMDMDWVYDKNDQIPVLQWKQVGKRSFVKGGLKLFPNGIQVNKSGYYFIYSNVMFFGNDTRALAFGRLCHYLYKYVENPLRGRPNMEKLLENLQSTCKVRRGTDSFAVSYIGAVYYLKQDMKVMVKASVPDNIDRAPQSTFFGLYMI